MKKILFIVLLSFSCLGIINAQEIWWHGGVSGNVNDAANWTDRSASTVPRTPTGDPRDIVRIGNSWGSEDLNGNSILDAGEDLNGNGVIDDPVPPNVVGKGGYLSTDGGLDLAVDPVLSETYISSTGTSAGGWWFILNAPNILTLKDGAFLIMSSENSNLRNGGRIEVQGRSDTDGPSLIVAKAFRIAENGSVAVAAGETSQIRIKGTGWVQMDPALKGSGAAFMIGTGDTPGTMPRGEIIIEENGRLEFLPAATGQQPYIDFGNADPSVNQIIIRDGGELWLPDAPASMGVVGASDAVTSLQDMIDMGLITNDKGGELTVTGADPTIVKVKESNSVSFAYVLDVTKCIIGDGVGYTSLDGTWNHGNGNDTWDSTAIGKGSPGGISVMDGYLRIQDVGNPTKYAMPDPSNRKLTMVKNLGDVGGTATILNDGATLFFRTKLATDGLLDSIYPDPVAAKSTVPATGDGYVIHNGGVGMFGIKQASGGMISFTLCTAAESGTVAGLMMNSLNGTALSDAVDKGEGTPNILALDPTVWHDFWITIQADGSGTGTHQVTVSVDGAEAQTFIVTAGNSSSYTDVTELRLGVGASDQSGVFDVAAFNFSPKIMTPEVPDDRVAEWKFDETSGTTVKDEIGTSDGIVYNMSDNLRVKGKVGKCLDFGSGSVNSYVEIADNAAIDFNSTTSFSISLLVNVDDISGIDMNMVWKGATGKNTPDEKGRWYGMLTSGNELRFAVDDDVAKSQLALVNAHTKMNMGQWNHVVGVRDLAAGMLYIYLNGEKVAEMVDKTKNEIASTPLPLIIGNNNGHTQNFKGKLDEIQLYNVALDATAINQLYKSYFESGKPEFVAQWMLDETTGTVAKDEAGASDGVVYNLPDALRVPGLVDNCINFGASDSAYIQVENNSTIDFDSTTSFSICALVNIADISGGDQNIVFKGHTSNDVEGHWYGLTFKSNELRFAIDDRVNKSQATFKNANEAMYMDGWNFVVGVRDVAQDSLFLYLNGEKVASFLDATGSTVSGLPLLIGNGQTHIIPFQGKIDEVTLFAEALSGDAIKEMATAYNISRKLSNNSALSDLLVEGITIEGFSSSVLDYAVELPEGTTKVPAVTAVTQDARAFADVKKALTLPGNTKVWVTAEDGTQTTYTIAFTVKPTVAVNNIGTDNIKAFYSAWENSLIFQNASNITKVEIYNTAGKKLVINKNSFSERMSLNNLNLVSNNMYIVRYESEGITRVMKFVK